MTELLEKPLPTNIEAERMVLGAILQENDYLPIVAKRLKPEDFFLGQNSKIFEAILEMHEDDTPPDPVTLADYLIRKGILEEVGGIAYVAGITDGVPKIVNAEHYAAIVKDKSILRDVIHRTHAIQRQAINEEVSGSELLVQATSSLIDLSAELDSPEDEMTYREAAIALIDSFDEQTKKMRAITGIEEVDRIIGGFRGGEVICVTSCQTGMGKAQPLDARILTPHGWRTMGSMKTGTYICSPNGKSVRVTGVYPRGKLPMVRMFFSDGSSLRCSPDHLWSVRSRHEKWAGHGYRVLSTTQIASDIRRGIAWYIPITKPIHFAKKAQPIDPYLLGALIGDGSLGVPYTPELTTADKWMVREVGRLLPRGMEIRRAQRTRYRYRIAMAKNCHGRMKSSCQNKLMLLLRDMGVACTSKKKFLPEIYKFGSISQRLALLQGLLDTDGSIHCNGVGLEYSTASRRLAEDVCFVAESLGCVCRIRQRRTKCNGRSFKSYRLYITPNSEFSYFRLPRKMKLSHTAKKYQPTRRIVAVKEDGRAEAQCIQVGSEEGLYLTERCLATHNSLFVEWIRRATCAQGGHGLYCSGEMTAMHLVGRGLASVSGVKPKRIRMPEKLTAEDKAALREAAMQECPFCTVLHGDLSLARIRMSAQRLYKVRGKLDVVVVDYDELVDAPGKEDNEKMKNLVRGLKRLAMLLDLPVILVSQLRKALTPGEMKKPSLERIHGSGAKSKHSSIVLFIDRPWVRDLKGDKTEAAVYILKNRDGDKGKVDCQFDVQKLKFVDVQKNDESTMFDPPED